MKDKDQQQELHKTMWNLADELRGNVDGWDFKQYVLGMLFYRFISEYLRDYINEGEIEAGDLDFDYAQLDDEIIDKETRQDLIDEKGFFLYPSQLFENVLKNADNDKNLNETLEKIFLGFETSSTATESESDFKGLFDDLDLNSGKLGSTVIERNERLAKLLKSIGDLELGSFRDHNIDAFGDAYEYLMSMYASQAGKSGGEYYTPQEVSELLTLIATHGKEEINGIYDPACGSGSLLLKAKKLFGDKKIRGGYYGQEVNLTTYNLCRMNMILHDVSYEKFDIKLGDTLTNPQHEFEEPFDAIVSNPPYSLHWEGKDNPVLVNDERFSKAGALAPKTKADLAFVLHALSYLSEQGTAAIVCFPGILYRGGAEKKIRQYLVDNNFIDSVIQLPPNLFFGTGIATCILVFRKDKTDNDILFIDASKYCYKSGNKNKLSQEDIKKIYDLYAKRKDVKYLSQLVSNDKIAEEDYNLSVSTYVEPEDTREKIDIEAVNKELEEIVAKENELRKKIISFIKTI